MQIISHRGYWKTIDEKNSELAFRRSFELGFGTETDIRDLDGMLVISHDMPNRGAMSLDHFLTLTLPKLPLALNIKSDGLAEPLRKTMARYDTRDWFVFDMSIPDMRAHLKAGNPVFARLSEVEQEPIWMSDCEGVWLDQFEGEWFDTDYIAKLLSTKKRVCVVSSELHRRDYKLLWKMLKPLEQFNNLMLCSDFPEEAKEYFSEQ